MKKTLLGLFAITLLVSCNENSRARHWGGTETINLETGERLVNVTWKENGLWILTKQDTTKPTTYSFKEKSQWEMMQGQITIIEK
jgi:hypothetical protein